MRTDILFISFNRKAEVEYNLKLMNSYPEVNSIIWVDNGSKDGTKDIDIHDYDKVKPLFLDDNVGIAAYNRGAEISDADILIILDDDSHVDNNAVALTKQKFEQDSKLGALGFRIVLPSTGEEVTDDWIEGDSTYFWGCGAAVRKDVWSKLGGYREELFLYGNEYDLAIRIWGLGYEVKFTRDITAYHRVSSMNRTSDRLVSYSIRNNYVYIKTYFSKKYQGRLMVIDRFTWFIRSVLSHSVGAFFEGIRMTKDMKITPYVISDDIQKFYIKNQRIFETPIRKIRQKAKYGKLLKVSKNV